MRLFNNYKTSLRFFSSSVSDAFIHPSAVVHANAVLGQGVSIGPFCTVGSSVKLGNGCRLHPGSHVFGDTQLGERCVLMTGAIVGDDLPGRTVLGCNNIIGHHAVVGVKCQDMKYKSGHECFLDVGDNNEIREHASIHRSSKSSDTTIVGNNHLIMGSCHIAHDCKVGNNVILANNTLLAGHVVVEDYAHTAGAVVVHQFCHVGSFAFIGGGSVIAQDVPKFMMVAGERAQLRGLNLEGLRRHGFTVTEIRSLRTAYQKIFMPADANYSGFEARLAEVVSHSTSSSPGSGFPPNGDMRRVLLMQSGPSDFNSMAQIAQQGCSVNSNRGSSAVRLKMDGPDRFIRRILGGNIRRGSHSILTLSH